ncbi:MAG: DNA-methyltransferase [Cetobacterium sp.]
MRTYISENDSIKLYNGDCLEVMDKLIENNTKVDSIITSPPYFQQRIYTESDMEIGKEEDFNKYLEAMINFMSKAKELITDGGLICINIGDKRSKGFQLVNYRFAIQCIDRLGLILVNNITWEKPNPTPMPHNTFLTPCTEPIFIFSKSSKYIFNKDNFDTNNEDMDKEVSTRKKSVKSKYLDMIENANDLTAIEKQNAKISLENTIQKVSLGEITGFRMKIRGIHALAFGGGNGGRNNQIKNNGFTIIEMKGKKMKRDIICEPVANTKDINHIAVYPERLPMELIKLTTNEGMTVLDPFMGSCTTGKVAKKLNRRFIGIELNIDYFDIAKKRINE